MPVNKGQKNPIQQIKTVFYKQDIRIDTGQTHKNPDTRGKENRQVVATLYTGETQEGN